jgi:hypothetical protein
VQGPYTILISRDELHRAWQHRRPTGEPTQSYVHRLVREADRYNQAKESEMAITKRPTMIYTLAEIRDVLKQPTSAEDVQRRQEALDRAKKLRDEMPPIIGQDIKDWIRQERGEGSA